MRRDLTASIVAVVALTLLLGIVYPLLTTGVAKVLFPNAADGSKLERDGRPVGSKLIGQAFTRRVPVAPAERGPGNRFHRVPDERYFQSRPSVTGYSADLTFFNNLGPNNKELRNLFRGFADAYLALERPYRPGLEVGDIPVDAVTTSGSGVDPHISEANAEIQAHRVAEVRGIPLDRVIELIDQNTADRALGVLGEPGVNVLELNLALDEEA